MYIYIYIYNVCRFSLKTVLMIADQMLYRIEYVHSRSWIYISNANTYTYRVLDIHIEWSVSGWIHSRCSTVSNTSTPGIRDLRIRLEAELSRNYRIRPLQELSNTSTPLHNI